MSQSAAGDNGDQLGTAGLDDSGGRGWPGVPSSAVSPYLCLHQGVPVEHQPRGSRGQRQPQAQGHRAQLVLELGLVLRHPRAEHTGGDTAPTLPLGPHPPGLGSLLSPSLNPSQLGMTLSPSYVGTMQSPSLTQSLSPSLSHPTWGHRSPHSHPHPVPIPVGDTTVHIPVPIVSPSQLETLLSPSLTPFLSPSLIPFLSLPFWGYRCPCYPTPPRPHPVPAGRR